MVTLFKQILLLSVPLGQEYFIDTVAGKLFTIGQTPLVADTPLTQERTLLTFAKVFTV